MNSQEKQKIEAVIREELSERKSAYMQRRDREFEVIREELVTNPPDDIRKMSKQLQNLKADIEKTRKKALQRGWKIETYNNVPVLMSLYEAKQAAAEIEMTHEGVKRQLTPGW